MGAIVVPLLGLLLWTCVVRLPFYTYTDKDEFFFSVIATQWANGGLPYVATFDIKPPGLFFLYLIGQAIFGASQLTFKGMEIVAVTAGAYALYAMLRGQGATRAGLWAAILFPVYSLAYGGTIAVNMLLQLPFIIAAFALIVGVISPTQATTRPMVQVFLAGLAIGAAATIKQTAAFEAIGILALILWYCEKGWRIRSAALFVLGAALPTVAFSVYFFANGHFGEMYEAVVTLALQRTDEAVIASYGPYIAPHLTLAGAFSNTVVMLNLSFFLVGSALFALVRLDLISRTFPSRVLVVAGVWFAVAFAGVVAGRAIGVYYMLAMVPPLLIVAAALYCNGLKVDSSKATRAFALSLAAAMASLFALDRDSLFMPDAFLAGDYFASRELSQKLLDLGSTPADRLLVVNRGYSAYVDTGMMPPGPYFHATHLLGVFHTPVEDPLGQALEADPRFIVLADPVHHHATELESRYDRVLDYVAGHYRLAGFVQGSKDSFSIYEFIR